MMDTPLTSAATASSTHEHRNIVAFDPDEPDWQDFACGGASACVNIVCTYPLFKLMIRQQIDGIRMFSAFGQLRREGFMTLYRGLLPPLLQKASSSAMMFGCYHKFQKILLSKYPSTNHVYLQICSGTMAGTLEACLTPFERVQTLLSDHKHHKNFNNTIHAFRKIWKHHTLKEYYRGFSAILLRNGPSTAMFFAFRGPIKDSMPTSNNSELLSFVEDFLGGALLGAALSTLFYPLNVVKSNMQRQLGGPYYSILHTFDRVYRQRGSSLRKLYFGVGVNFSRALVSWGIINATYEMFRKILLHKESYEHVL